MTMKMARGAQTASVWTLQSRLNSKAPITWVHLCLNKLDTL